MHITLIIIVTYIVCCFRVGTVPWKFFQINARYYSKEEGIFSKLAIDNLIPERWRLHQTPDDPLLQPETYPVFLKPEWGQNAHGIKRADSFEQLQTIRAEIKGAEGEQRYIMQQGAPGKREFEVFSIDVSKSDGKHDVVTVTEAVNKCESYPINSKYNTNTQYVDISDQFGDDQLVQLSDYLDELGQFAISRMSVRADTINDLVAGNFHVIEVNLFLPMPINLLDNSYNWRLRFQFIRRAMMSLALATKAIKPVAKPQPIFTNMMLYGRRKRATSNNVAKFTARRPSL